MKLIIRPQYYPTVLGTKPLSYAIWLIRPMRRRVFLAYSWSLSGALRAVELMISADGV